MLLKANKDYVKKINTIIDDLTVKKSLSDQDTLMCRIIWNYFTDNNRERKRSMKLIDLYIENNSISLKDVIGKK